MPSDLKIRRKRQRRFNFCHYHRYRAPFPASLWTRTRNLPVAPEESLRQWWRRTHPDGITPAATVEAARRALKNQEEK